jgi:hypothetical protein
MTMKKRVAPLMAFALMTAGFQLCVSADEETLLTFADGRSDGGIRQSAEVEDGLDSPGDVFVFDQKLLAADAETVIGRNAGFCIRTDPGAPDFSSPDHPTLPDDPNNNYGQCSWTLSFSEDSGYTGSIQVSGRESDIGTSEVPIVGGTGDFLNATGVLRTTPVPQGENGVLFRQELEFESDGGEEGDDEVLSLGDNRFEATVEWQDGAGKAGIGQVMRQGGDSGSFWFFSPENTELTVKVLDGRGVNGHFWVFYGSLTHVAFELRVTDTETGEERVYTNLLGEMSSGSDTNAF